MQRIIHDSDVAAWRSSHQYNAFVRWIQRRSSRIVGRDIIYQQPHSQVHNSSQEPGGGSQETPRGVEGSVKERERTPATKTDADADADADSDKEQQPSQARVGPIGRTRIDALIDILDVLEKSVQRYPPIKDGKQRFGNKAFKDWWENEVRDSLPSLIATLPDIPQTLVQSHILPLLINSHAFGHPIRLDYGSGHELSFVAVLWGLTGAAGASQAWLGLGRNPDQSGIGGGNTIYTTGKEGEGDSETHLDLENEEDELVLNVFPKYLELVTIIQKTYNLEPAGSHGVWGLDDYCFLPYVWGSAQLLRGYITPEQALKNARKGDTENGTLEPIKDLWTLTLRRLFSFKSGPFHEHSPLLHSLSTTMPSFTKIHSGLFKMYQEEVLGKKVVVQHIWFNDWLWEGTSQLLAASRRGVGAGDHVDAYQSQKAKQDAVNASWATATAGKDANGSESATKAPWATSAHTPAVGERIGGGGGGTKAPWATPITMETTKAPWATGR